MRKRLASLLADAHAGDTQLLAIVTRADGRTENLGLIAAGSDNLLRRIAYQLLGVGKVR